MPTMMSEGIKSPPHQASPSALRRLVRRWVPRPLRAELARVRREIHDRHSDIAFASGQRSPDEFPYHFEGYRLPLLFYPGQEHLADGKRHNQQLMASALHGACVQPGEVFSLWHLAGRPSAARGYLPGAAIVNDRLIAETGGAVCLLSTVLYNAGLLAALEIVERHAHSVDSYGEDRYFEIGRDATIDYGVLDLRLRNNHPYPVLLDISADDSQVAAAFRASQPDLPSVMIEVQQLPTRGEREPDDRLLSARTLRHITPPGGAARVEDLGWSCYLMANASHFTSATS